MEKRMIKIRKQQKEKEMMVVPQREGMEGRGKETTKEDKNNNNKRRKRMTVTPK